MTALLLDLLRALACLALLAVTAWAAGRSLRRWTLREPAPGKAGESWGLELALDLALGLALLAHAFWLLALLGLFAPLAVGAVVLTLHGLAFLPGGGWRDLRRQPVAGVEARRWTKGARLAAGALVLSLFAPLFVLALYPPTGFDETLYHLPFTRAFTETGRLELLWDLRVPVFPQLAEALSAGPYLAMGESGPHFVSLLATLATAGLIVAWGKLRFSSVIGLLGAAIYLGNPITAHLGTSGYIDPLLTLFVVAAFLAVERGIDRLRAFGAGSTAGRPLGWFLLAGFLIGSAAGTKYLGLFFAGVQALSVFLRVPSAWRWRAAFAFATTAGLVLAPTYLRLWILTGNPLFPFLPSVFGSSVWDPEPMISGPLVGPREPAWQRWLFLPWRAVFDRQVVGWQPPFAPWLLLGLPLLARSLWRDARVRTLGLVPLLWSFVFLFLPADVRYLMPMLPLVSLALGAAVASWGSPVSEGEPGKRATILGAGVPARWPAWAVAPLLVVLAAPGPLYVGYRLLKQGPLPVRPAERSAYLRREIPLYGAIEALNERLGDRYALYALSGENLRYFVRGRLLGDWTNRYPYSKILPLLGEPQALDRQLAEFGATHLALPLAHLRSLRHTPEAEAAWRRFFVPVYVDRAATVYFRLRAGGGAGATGSGSRSPKATEKSLR